MFRSKGNTASLGAATRLEMDYERRMEQRISFVTLAVKDVARARAFYVDNLGWTPNLDVPGEVLMFQVGPHLILSLWDRKAFEAEVGAPPAEGVPPLTLAHNLPTKELVDQVLETARQAGAPKVTAAVQREWGGYSGYFADPDGFRWEIAFNPLPLGQLVLP